MRTCIGCRRRRTDRELIRVAVAPDGDTTQIMVGKRGIGRGAWLCPDPECVELAARSRAFSRALRSKLADRVCADTLLGWLGEPSR